MSYRRITAGPGDEATWPRYYGHPNDPRRPASEDAREAAFEEWFEKVCDRFERRSGLSLKDMADRDYWPGFEGEEDPKAYADRLFEEFDEDPWEFL